MLYIVKIINLFYLLNVISKCEFGIELVLVLLYFENMNNTNTTLTVGIVFQYNTSRIVYLWIFMMAKHVLCMYVLSHNN